MNKSTQLMGILNITPDSFYEGSRSLEADNAIERGIKMAADGADILDIGGESTRPGAPSVPLEEELNRILPVIEGLKKNVSIPLSIDTIKAPVAWQAVQAGADLINDVSGFQSAEMREVAASCNVDLCVMHMQGTPRTMQLNPHYPEGIIPHLLHWFEKQITLLAQSGISETRLILDPGIGFGKTVEHNLEILTHLKEFKRFGCRLLVGLSRKSFMGKILNKPVTELLSTTLAVNTMAILAEVDIIRVHDVREHRDIINLLTRLKHFNMDHCISS